MKIKGVTASLVFLGFTVAFAILIQSCSAQFVTSTGGEISDLDVNPEKVTLPDMINIKISVKNTGSQERNYKLKLIISNEGKVRHLEEFKFTLSAGEKTTLQPSFKPSKTGGYIVIAKLTDQKESLVYSRRTSKVEIRSDLGPFDLSAEPLSENVRPGQKLPILFRIRNLGAKGVDATVKTEMECAYGEKSHDEFEMFLQPYKTKGNFEKLEYLETCPSTGNYRVISKLIVDGEEWIRTINEVSASRNPKPLSLRFPGNLEMEKGESGKFEVIVKSKGSEPIYNLRLKAGNIPQNWYNVEPNKISHLEPGGYASFLVNVSVPENIKTGDHPFSISVGSDKSLVTGRLGLKILEGGEETRDSTKIYPFIKSNKHVISYLLIFLIVVIIIYKWKGKGRQERNERLEKIKRSIGV